MAMRASTRGIPRFVKILSVPLLVCSVSAQSQVREVELAPPSSKQLKPYLIYPARQPAISEEAKLKLVRSKVKHVFILFQENRAFDFYFGTYPGAEGLFSHPADQTPGFTQPIVNVDGTIGSVTAFRIPTTVQDINGKTVPLYPADIASVNHSHVSIAKKLNLDANLVARNDLYAVTEEGITLTNGKPSKFPSLERKQFGELVMSHVDCDTVPFLWNYADRFTLFDQFFDTVIGPSGPNAVAMIAGQSGETQWMLHPELAEPKDGSALPMVANALPYWGSLLDLDHRMPQPKPAKRPLPNLTFATLPLSFMGDEIELTTSKDRDPAFDLPDVKEDIAKIAGHGVAAVKWGWYQQGYDHEPTDVNEVASHKGYVIHHNGPAYFGYIANNPDVTKHLHGLAEFFDDVKSERLPESGVFYVRGGYGNLKGTHPMDPNPRLAGVFSGNDDHPGYSDSQISEALLAQEINAIARSPYWKDSVILIAYDESDGLYDHTRPKVRSHDAAGLPLDQGPRIPSILISPYGVAHGISHQPAEHSSIIKMVDKLFGLIPLADLPDEERGRQIGKDKFGQNDLGPADDKVAGVGDMLSGFDTLRLMGKRKPLPASYAIIPDAELDAFPHMKGEGCKALGIRPTDFGKPNPVPADFNPRPDTSPGIPTSGKWIP
jgi:phospholipase C